MGPPMVKRVVWSGSKRHTGWQAGYIVACTVFATITVLYLTTDLSLTSGYAGQTAYRRNKLWLSDAEHDSGVLTPTAQLVSTELRKLPGSNLIQKYILPLTDMNKLSAADLPALLQATNFTSLASARILDAASSIGSQEKWQLMNLHQQLFCRAGLTKDQRYLANTVAVPQGNFSIHVYKDNDIVSRFLAGDTHSYEPTEVEEVLWALQQHKPKPQQAHPGQQLMEHTPLMVDVGANVGTFLFKVAAAGYKVAAFEGMPSNVALLRHSLCANPQLAERVALYGTGLGPQSSTCWVISDNGNVGDGHTVCDEAELKQRTNKTGYNVRGEMSVRRLDSILAEDVQALKMDVEGFEHQVLLGAEGLLKKHNVQYIVAECTFGGDEKRRDFLKYMDDLGYQVSLNSFKGPFLEAAAIRNRTSKLPVNNIYCVKREVTGKPSLR